MYAIIKKRKDELTAKYLLPSLSDPVEHVDFNGDGWTLVEWNIDLVKADVYNEIVKGGGLFFDTSDEINSYIKENFIQEKILL